MRLLVCLAAALYATAAFSQGGPPGGGGPPPLSNHPGVYIDQRDFQGNRTTTERTIFPNPHPAIEYSFTTNLITNVTHVAYTKGSTITAQVRFKNDTDFPFSGNLNFVSARLACPGLPSGTEYLPLTISSSQSSLALPARGTASVTVTIGGAPNHIAVGGLEVKYSLILMKNPGPDQEGPYENGTGQSGWENWVRVCLLDSAPIGLQAVPWTDFLEYTCRWAFGASGPAAVRREMTKGIFYGNRSPWNRLYYNSAINNYWKWTDADGNYIGTGPYRLGLLLGTLSSPINRQQSSQIWTSADCRDFAGLLFLAISSHGASSPCTILTGPTRILLDVNGNPVLDEDQQPIITSHYNYWPLCPAGSDPTDTDIDSDFSAGSYTSGAFNFHVVVESSGLRFDAAAAHYYSSSGGPWYNPVFDWSSASHWQRSSPWPYHGHAFSLNAKFNFLTTPFGQGSETVTLSQTYENPIYLVGSGTP